MKGHALLQGLVKGESHDTASGEKKIITSDNMEGRNTNE